MPSQEGSARKPLSHAHARLGAELRRIRKAARLTTRDIPKPAGGCYGSGSISNIEGGHSIPSPTVIKAYARLGGSYADLIALLAEANRSMQPESTSDAAFDRQLLDPRTDPYILRRGYAVDLQEDISYLANDGAPTHNVYRLAVRPLSAAARYFVLRYGHTADERRGVASVQAGTGCEVNLVDEADDGIIFAVLKFNQDNRDHFGRCNFTYVIKVNSDVPSNPHYALYTESLITHIIKRVQFEPPALPEKIWWFRGSDPFQHRLEPSPKQLLEPNPTNFYYYEFYDVEGESCGLAWRWTLTN